MARNLVTSANGSFKQMTLTSGESGYVWLDVSRGKYVKLGVSNPSGDTFDVVAGLANVDNVDKDGNAITPTIFVESAGETADYTGRFNPGMARVGVNLSVAITGTMIIEVSEGR